MTGDTRVRVATHGAVVCTRALVVTGIGAMADLTQVV